MNRIIRVVWHDKTLNKYIYDDYKYSDYEIEMSQRNEVVRIYEKSRSGHIVAMYKNWDMVEIK